MQHFKTKPLWLAVFIGMSANAIANTTSDNEKDKDIETITVSPKGLISYVSAAASKSDTPIVETPVSVSVLTQKRIQDIGAETLQDAIGFVAGVYNGPYGVDTRGDWSKIRGVDPLQYLDGLQMMFGYYNNARPNPYMLERVEILKGPSSTLYGQGSTGGIINSISKRPKSGTFGEIWAQLGNYDRKQLAGDFNTELNDDESLLFRVNGMWRDSGTQTDYVDDNTLYVAPSLSWFASDATKINLSANIQKNESGSSTQFFPHVGTIKPAPFGQIPSERFVSEPGWDKYDTEQQAFTLQVEHEINDLVSVSWNSRYSSSESTYRTMYSANWPPTLEADNRSMARRVLLSDGEADVFTTDLQLHAIATTGEFDHTIVAGIDYQNAKTNTDRGYDIGGLIDLYTPNYGQLPNLPIKVSDAAIVALGDTQKDTQMGFYLQDSIKYGDLVINAVLRHDRVESKVDVAGGETEDQNATTGRLGVLYSFDNGLAPYASYSESFKPIYGQKAQGGSFKPQQGEQIEVGLKYQPQGTEHLFTLAVYDIKDTNFVRSTPEFDYQDGEVKIQGVELEAQLEFDQVDVYASYAYTDSENLTSDQPGLKGAKLSAVPDHMLSTWLTYRPERFLPGLKLGAGLRYVGETGDGSTDVVMNGQTVYQAVTTDSYELFDLMIGYEFDQFDISLNVDNVADDTVITSCLSRGDCFYGQRRTVTANVKYRF